MKFKLLKFNLKIDQLEIIRLYVLLLLLIENDNNYSKIIIVLNSLSIIIQKNPIKELLTY